MKFISHTRLAVISSVAFFVTIPFIKEFLAEHNFTYLPALLSAASAQETQWNPEETDTGEKRNRYRQRLAENTYRQNSPATGLFSEDFDETEIDLIELPPEKVYDFSFSENRFIEYQQAESLRQIEDMPTDRGIGVDYGEVKLRIYGRTNVRASYGDSYYLSEDDRLDDQTQASSTAVKNGFDLDMDMQVNVKGKIGRKVTVNIDYDKNEKQSENTFQVQYKALRRREFVQEVTLGNIDLSFPKSEFAVFEQKSKQTVGLQSKMRRGKLQFHGIATLTQGKSFTDSFTGSKRTTSARLAEYRYTARKYYQLEPYIFYGDSVSGCPVAIDSNSYDRNSSSKSITFTSAVDNPASFVAYQVDIDAGTLEVYLDDADPRNDLQLGATNYSPNGTSLGNYHRLIEGRDYVFSYNSGRLQFLKFLRPEYRIYVRYQRAAGSCDPSVRSSGGFYETFIKWDSQMHEDTSRDGGSDVIIIDDGITNYDAYEVRGVYNLGTRDIEEAGFQISLLDRNFQKIDGFNYLGSYDMGYELGILAFFLREPFKNLKATDGSYFISDTALNTLYTEIQPSYVAENSEVNLRIDYSHEVRNYQLSHFNILPNSVQVRINNQILSPELYYVDASSGYFTFTDPNNPLIGPDTKIDISYEYSPYGAGNQGYIVGMRTDYDASRSLQLGGTVLFNGQFEPTEAPRVGSEPVSRLVLESDLSLTYNEERLTRMVNTFPGLDFDLLPLKFESYAEYAQSFYNPNTFGFALIDDMESSEEVADIEISEKDWMLSSVPPSIQPGSLTESQFQCNRAPLYYRYYRDPDDYRKGTLDFAAGAKAAPPYSQLSGPYNVAEGHLDSSQVDISRAEKQISLVLDFDYSKVTPVTGNPYVSIVTRNYSSQGADFSNVTYLEYYVKLQDASGLDNGVRVYFDIGTVNEDTDSDQKLETEDIGLDGISGDTNNDGTQNAGEIYDSTEGNGIIDTERSSGKTEDIGITFDPPDCDSSFHSIIGAGPDISGHPATRGNGVLDREDLDSDGRFNTIENVVTFADQTTYAYLHPENTTENLITPGDWQLVRVYIDQSALSDQQKLAMRQVKSVRMYIVPEAGSENGNGKLLIDSLRFGGSRWRQITLTDIDTGVQQEVSNPDIFRVATIDNFASKAEYQNESFLVQERSTYEALHGKKTNTEYARTREAALKMSYTLDTGSTRYSQAFARRAFMNAMDLQFYSKLNVWVNYRNLTSTNQYFMFRVGSSDYDYYEYRYPVDQSGWQKLELSLDTPHSVTGYPNIKEINTMVVGVATDTPSSTTGVIWVNDIYVSDPKIQSDSAYKYQASLEVTRPLIKTESGVPILSDIQTTYKRWHKGKRFSSIGQTQTNIDEDRIEYDIASKIFPFWNASYGYTRRTTTADDNEIFEVITSQGYSNTVTHATNHQLRFSNPHVPMVTANYQYRNFYNIRKTRITDTLADAEKTRTTITQEDTYSPSVSISENFPPIFGSNLKYQLKTSMKFYDRKETEQTFLSNNTLDDTNIKNEGEQTEDTTNSFTWQMGDFSISPSYSYKQVILTDKNYTDNNNLETVNGRFYAPLFEKTDDFRYRQRSTRYQLSASYSNLYIVSPSVEFTADYKENSFKDNQQTFTYDKYQRLKTPSTMASSRVSLPLNLTKVWSGFSFIKSLTPSFSREISLTESNMPFTTMTSVYDEEQGFSRTINPLADSAYNLVKFPFWYNFLSPGRSKGNFARGRDYIHTSKIEPAPEPGYEQAFINYNNNLTLRETINTTAQWDLVEPLILRTDTRLAQNISRSTLEALPVHNANWGYSVLQTWNLMKLFDFWFWGNKAKHTSGFDLNYSFDRTMRITENMREDRHVPSTGITFSWYDEGHVLSSLTFRVGLNIRILDHEPYLSTNDPYPDSSIYASLPPVPEQGLKQKDTSYEYSIEYKTEMPSLKRSLQKLTDLTLRYNPKYTSRFSVNLNRYDYDLSTTLSRKAKDQYILFQNLDINLHANVTGGLDLTAAWDIWRDPYTNVISQEILSFQIGMFARILF